MMNTVHIELIFDYQMFVFSANLLAAYLNTGIILMTEGHLEEAKRTFLTCADIPDENLKDPHAHRSSVTSCLYNLGKLLHEQGHQEVSGCLGEGAQSGGRAGPLTLTRKQSAVLH